ncbi:unnamed protein product [Protopolystoma xenopodis]|uniref:Uncharacterized protein n=1 Tax=Protopolystoma xenopodis TaxID=117903 RepID=A0A3S5FCQ6_9PLAT|nr:unnamed protein product [Protopolystoma xenopodis]
MNPGPGWFGSRPIQKDRFLPKPPDLKVTQAKLIRRAISPLPCGSPGICFIKPPSERHTRSSPLLSAFLASLAACPHEHGNEAILKLPDAHTLSGRLLLCSTRLIFFSPLLRLSQMPRADNAELGNREKCNPFACPALWRRERVIRAQVANPPVHGSNPISTVDGGHGRPKENALRSLRLLTGEKESYATHQRMEDSQQSESGTHTDTHKS